MASLFGGSPTMANTSTTSASELPKFMMDAITAQVNQAVNVAQKPYEAYQGQMVAGLSPYQQQAYSNIAANQGKWQPALSAAAQGMQDQTTGMYGSQTAAPYLNQAANVNIQGAAQPYMQQAAKSSVSDIASYMNPYQQQVMDVMAKQGARNLSENILPGVSDSFIKAGQFGSGRMGEFGSRAVRDTQEAVLNQQAQLANQGYNTALGAAQTDQSRQAALAGTAGQLAQQQQSGLASIGGQFGSLAGSDLARQQSALGALAQFGQMGQQMSAADAAALEAAGKAQQGQQQTELNTGYQQWLEQQNYPKTQLDWLNNQVRGISSNVPQTTTSTSTQSGNSGPSPLSQLAAAMAGGAGIYKALS